MVAALRSGNMASSKILKNVDWSSIPYTLSRNIMIDALWVGIRPGGRLTAGGAVLSAVRGDRRDMYLISILIKSGSIHKISTQLSFFTDSTDHLAEFSPNQFLEIPVQ